MTTHKPSNYSPHIKAFVAFHHDLYSKALQNGDTRGLAESGGVLCICYAALGQGELARKWAEEYFANLASQDLSTTCKGQS